MATNWLQNLGNAFYSGYQTASPYIEKGFNWLTTPMGSGEQAISPLQLGGQGLSAWFNYNNFQDQLDQAEKALQFSQGNTRANLMNQGTNFLNQSLFQLESLNAFNPNAAQERAQNLLAGANQLNNAASQIGIDNAFGSQIDQIKKYNQLAGN